MKYDSAIDAACRAAIDRLGTKSEFARQIGAHPSLPGKYAQALAAGVEMEIREDLYARMYDVVRTDLPDDEAYEPEYVKRCKMAQTIEESADPIVGRLVTALALVKRRPAIRAELLARVAMEIDASLLLLAQSQEREEKEKEKE